MMMQSPLMAANAVPILEGRWAPKSEGCAKSTRQFDYSRKSLGFPQFSCDVKKIRNYNDYRYFLDVECGSGADRYEDTLSIDVTSNKLIFLHMPNLGSNYEEFLFCRAGRPSAAQKVPTKAEAAKTEPAPAAAAPTAVAAPASRPTAPSKPRSTPTFTSTYEGRVGNSQVDVTLSYYRDGTVYGEYVTRLLRNRYLLTGHNRNDGQLDLEEYTNGRHTANVNLEKVNNARGRLTWIGKMHNLDGRVVDVVFVRK
jgi:hypothetical protein